MSYLIDTDWIIDWLNQRRRAHDLMSRLKPEGLFLSLMSYGEIYEGVYCSRNVVRAEAAFAAFLRDTTLLGFDEETMKTYATLRGELRRQGRPLGEGDLLIAASAIRNDLELVTGNTKDFGRVPGLRLYQPS